MKRDFVSVSDFSAKEMDEIFTLAKDLKAKTKKGVEHKELKDRTWL